MNEQLQFDKDDFDLEGLLSLSERAQADLLFMIYDEEEDLYYLDRQEIQKYDVGFNQFTRRVSNYLDCDESRGLFILFAVGAEENVAILNGKLMGTHPVDTGDLVLSEAIYYGIMLQCEDTHYVFKEALYLKDKGDDHAEIIEDYTGDLARLVEVFIEEFQ